MSTLKQNLTEMVNTYLAILQSQSQIPFLVTQPMEMEGKHALAILQYCGFPHIQLLDYQNLHQHLHITMHS